MVIENKSGVLDCYFKDFPPRLLRKIKKKKGLKVAVGIPIKNEKKTIEDVISRVRKYGRGLVDQIAVFDSGSTDGSQEIVKKMGVPLIEDRVIVRKFDLKNWRRGKGFNLWASVLYFRKADIIIWIDGDLKVEERYILGILGPLIMEDKILFSKGQYTRPESDSRVTRFLEPILGQLGGVFILANESFKDPLCGLYGGKRVFLEEIPFSTGYSVELVTLIYSLAIAGSHRIAQVELGELKNRERSNEQLSKMFGSIVYSLFEMSHDLGGTINIDREIPNRFIQWDNSSSNKSPREHKEIRDLRLPLVRDILAERRFIKKGDYYFEKVAGMVKKPYEIIVNMIIWGD